MQYCMSDYTPWKTLPYMHIFEMQNHESRQNLMWINTKTERRKCHFCRASLADRHKLHRSLLYVTIHASDVCLYLTTFAFILICCCSLGSRFMQIVGKAVFNSSLFSLNTSKMCSCSLWLSVCECSEGAQSMECHPWSCSVLQTQDCRENK